MGKGPSIHQVAVVEALKKKGALNVLDVASLMAAIKKGGVIVGYESIEQVPNAQGIYRMMRSLEKRGLVARLLHRRPAVWYYVTWQGEEPEFPGVQKVGACYDYNCVMERNKQAEFATRGELWVIK